MNEFWRIALGIAGLGAIASFLIWSLYRQWLTLPIFQTMTKRQQFILFMTFFLLTFLFGLAALTTYVLTHQPSKSDLEGEVSYSIYLDSENTPFIERYESSSVILKDLDVRMPKDHDTWYLRRHKDFRPHSLFLFFDEFSNLTDEQIIEELNNIPSNSLLHDTLLSPQFNKILESAGEFLDVNVRSAISQPNTNAPNLAELLKYQVYSNSSLAALYMLHTYGDFKKLMPANSGTFIHEIQNVWKKSNSTTFTSQVNRYSKSLLLKQLNPILLLSIENQSNRQVLISHVKVSANVLERSASGLGSGKLEILDTIVVNLEGVPKQEIIEPLHRPISISPGDVGAIRLILNSELMFIYQIEISLFDGNHEAYAFDPFIVDYFSEV